MKIKKDIKDLKLYFIRNLRYYYCCNEAGFLKDRRTGLNEIKKLKQKYSPFICTVDGGDIEINLYNVFSFDYYKFRLIKPLIVNFNGASLCITPDISLENIESHLKELSGLGQDETQLLEETINVSSSKGTIEKKIEFLNALLSIMKERKNI